MNPEVGYQLGIISLDHNLWHQTPRYSGKVTHITGEFSFRYHHLLVTGSPADALPNTVYGLDYLLAATHTFNARWSMIGVASLGLFSDFQRISGDDLLLSGGILGVYTVSSRMQVGIGPEVTYVFGEPRLIPIPYLNWYLGNKFMLDIQAPTHAILHYNASKLLHFKLAGRFRLGTRYSIRGGGAEDDAYLLFSEGTVGLDTQLQPNDHFSVQVALAYALYRRMELTEQRGFNPATLPGQKYRPQPGFLPRLSLNWWF